MTAAEAPAGQGDRQRHPVRGVTIEDLDALESLDRMVFAPAEVWNRRLWADELAADNRVVQVITDEADALLGVSSIQVVGPTAELIRIAVAPASQGRGLGSALLDAALRSAAEAEVDEMLLEVRHDNSVAMALYRRLGFTEIARRADYYGPGADAVIMQRELEDTDD